MKRSPYDVVNHQGATPASDPFIMGVSQGVEDADPGGTHAYSITSDERVIG